MIRTALFAATLASALAGCTAPDHRGAMADATTPAATPTPATDAALAAAIAGDWRNEARARDVYRHPLQTLSFFGIEPGDTIIEITPGGGWYADILAPYLRDSGRYVAAVVDPMSQPAGKGRDYQQRNRDQLQAKFSAAPERFDRAALVAFDPKAPVFGPPASADVVLTFRNVHNWRMAGHAPQMFQGFHAVLKPGGVLGVVEHRARGDVPDDDRSGYVGEQQLIAMATAAGFELDGKSEVNANPKDTTDHPNGVWTLPPTNDHDAEDDGKYAAIGESDRMTLRFVKPAR